MFGLPRRKSRAALARAELGESFDHLRQAAAYATGGVGAAVTPRVRTARAYVAPKAAKVKNTAADGLKLEKMSRKKMTKAMRGAPMTRGKASTGRRRWPVAGLLVAGAIAGYVALRRRRESEWEAYDPAADLDIVHPGGTAAAAGHAERVRSASVRSASTVAGYGSTSGVSGATGQAGTIGMAGRAGTTGAAGQAGTTGAAGQSGASGTAGHAGTTGMAGHAGATGAGGGQSDGVLGSPSTGSGGGRG